MTHNPLFYVTLFACLAVLGVLLFGVASFAKGGDFNRRNANRIMRLRVLAQFVAVLLIVALAYFTRGG